MISRLGGEVVDAITGRVCSTRARAQQGGGSIWSMSDRIGRLAPESDHSLDHSERVGVAPLAATITASGRSPSTSAPGKSTDAVGTRTRPSDHCIGSGRSRPFSSSSRPCDLLAENSTACRAARKARGHARRWSSPRASEQPAAQTPAVPACPGRDRTREHLMALAVGELSRAAVVVAQDVATGVERHGGSSRGPARPPWVRAGQPSRSAA